MGDISSHVSKDSQTVAAIYAHYKKQGDTGYLSKTLGISQIGRPCERYLWYLFRQCVKSKFSGRMYRLFERGNLEESRLITNLRAIGCTVHSVDESTGKQFLVTDLGGHVKGYLDGCAIGIPEAPKTWHVLEFKTHNAKSFAALKNNGVMASKPEHYAQVVLGMYLTGMKRGLYLGTNKDTDEIHSERIASNPAEAVNLIEKARRIITAIKPPNRISNRPDYYLCNQCDAKGICWGTQPPEPALPVPKLSCRHCCYATPVIDGENATWICERNQGRSFIDTDKPCSKHLILPELLAFTEPDMYRVNEHGQDYIIFKNADGGVWQHGNAPGCIGSEVLTSLPACLLADSMVQTACNSFGAKPTAYCPSPCSAEDDIFGRYADETSRIVWEGNILRLIEKWCELYKENLAALTPIAKADNLEGTIVEYEGDRAVILWHNTRHAEIRERTN